MAAKAHYGITGTISDAPPSDHDLRLFDPLVQELKLQNNFAPREETDKREALLAKLRRILLQMVEEVGKKKGLPQSLLQEAGGVVFPYGSYKLGVYGPGSDIDTLLIAAKHVTRQDFFEHMPRLIKENTKPGEIGGMVPVPDTHVPIIKLELEGVEIDLIFTALQLSAIPKALDLNDTNLLRGLDDIDFRCINGARVTVRILNLVPQTKTFRMALRAVKLWAQKRAIYGGNFGYPAGVSYGMMVARVCQLYPQAAAPLIISRFFRVVRSWDWPKPMRLQESELAPGALSQRQWDPSTSRVDASHLMPVITPVYPSMNSTHTIGPSSKKVLMRELERGEEIVGGIYDGKKQWKDLFQRHDFFTSAYKNYICVIAGGKNKESQKAWTGFVQSRLKKLVYGIEVSEEARSVELVQMFSKSFDHVHECRTDHDVDDSLDGGLRCVINESQKEATESDLSDVITQAAAESDRSGAEVKQVINGDAVVKDGMQKVWTSKFYLGIGLVKGAKGLDISLPIRNFKSECMSWQSFDADVLSIRIKHVRNIDLPADVFQAGDVRPVKAKKAKPATNGAPPANSKRSLADAALDENADPAKRRQSANGRLSIPNGSTPTPNGIAG